MSEIYNLQLAQQFEQERGLTYLSPMSPATIGMLQEFSPPTCWLANNFNCDILLLLHGENDPVAPPAYSQELHLLLTERQASTSPWRHLKILCTRILFYILVFFAKAERNLQDSNGLGQHL